MIPHAMLPSDEDVVCSQGGIVRAARRPPGWSPPGPAAAAGPWASHLWPSADEDLCWLAGNWRILQRRDGHRYSLDDVVTAACAADACAIEPARVLDLGCGIGTVLLFCAWRFPQAQLVGVEAQPISAAMARRSIEWNGVTARCQVRLGDLRDAQVLQGEPAFDLITGTPPYFPRGSGVESDHVQRGPCRFEHRGGIEAYCATAAVNLRVGGLFVACAPAGQRERVHAAAAHAQLSITWWRDVVPRAGKLPLVSTFAMRRASDVASADAPPPDARLEQPLVVRDRAGKRTKEFVMLRARMGMPP